MAFEFALELSRRYREFRSRWRNYAKVIKELASEFFGENLVAVYVFGSVVRGDYRALSDVDTAVVLKQDVDECLRARFRSLVRGRLGRMHPFEIHVVTEGMWEGWYKRFVGKDYVEV